MRLVLAILVALVVGASVGARPASAQADVVPRLVWIREWGVTLREGIDIVHAHGAYYRYADGRWHWATSPAGPWSAVGGIGHRRSRQAPAPLAALPPSVPTRPDRGAEPETTRQHGEARRIVATAMAQVGAAYVWGGASPAGFDCSGLVRYAFARVGITLPHNVAQQYRYGVPVEREHLEPGDLVFFDRLRHNGIYIGGGRFVHATRSGKTVEVSRLDEGWFERHWVGARRVTPGAQTARGD